MELVTGRDVGLEEKCDSLVEVVDVAETNIDVEPVLFLALLGTENMGLVRLWGCLIARDLDQFRHFYLQWEITLSSG